jgi:hypothetical protein
MVRPVPVRTAPPVAAPPVAGPFVPPAAAPAHSGGTPAWMGWTVAVAGLLVVGLLAAVAVLVLRPTTVTVAAPAPITTTRTVVPSAPADDTVSGYRAGSTDTDATSAALLAEGVAADRASVESLVGSWVPQLSSKRLGTVADGITYDSTAILGHYNELSDRYGPVRLVDSGDWPVFRESDYWVVVAAQPFSTAARANAWCSAQGLGADDCFAKRLAHSGTSAANTETR